MISITLPPLRERRDDILDLAIHFLANANDHAGKGVSQIDDRAMEALLRYPWPGNIRELENVIERAVVLAEGDKVTLTDLPRELVSLRPGPRHILEAKPVVGTLASDRPMRLLENGSRSQPAGDERQQLAAALALAEGNKAEAARALGMPRSTFYSKLKKYALD